MVSVKVEILYDTVFRAPRIVLAVGVDKINNSFHPSTVGTSSCQRNSSLLLLPYA
jgi:hypothetical protein